MALPNALAALKSGVVGQFSHDAPRRVAPFIMKSTNEADNVFGRAFTLVDQDAETVEAGGLGAFMGILVDPNKGVDQEFLKNNTIGGLCQMGDIFVKLVEAVVVGATPTAPAVGGKVYFVEGTGELTADADDGDQTPVQHVEIKGAVIVRHAPSEGAAQISLTGILP
jgi:hypothetical protein